MAEKKKQKKLLLCIRNSRHKQSNQSQANEWVNQEITHKQKKRVGSRKLMTWMTCEWNDEAHYVQQQQRQQQLK